MKKELLALLLRGVGRADDYAGVPGILVEQQRVRRDDENRAAVLEQGGVAAPVQQGSREGAGRLGLRHVRDHRDAGLTTFKT